MRLNVPGAQTGDEIIAWCRRLARISDSPGATTRTYLSSATRLAHQFVIASMREAGLETRVDDAGNIRGRRQGAKPPFLIGSHIDTVPNAGAFDGVLGVGLGIAIARSLPTASLEVIAFSEEEGVRYGIPFIGSRAVAGGLDQELKARIEPAVREFGLNPDKLDDAALDYPVAGFFEIHIEQGPVLEHMGEALGIVEAIAGQNRMTFRFTGAANHAGTTPMHLRRDALAAAAEWLLEAEREARGTNALMATVGRMEVQPDATNVIPGEVTCSLDVRHAGDHARTRAVERMVEAARAIASRRNIALEIQTNLDRKAICMDDALTNRLEQAAQRTGRHAPRLISGAGHDAMIFAALIPAAMLFVRSPGGISHHPDESVFAEDVEAALAVGIEFMSNEGKCNT